jgi:hypothetical protein
MAAEDDIEQTAELVMLATTIPGPELELQRHEQS